MELTGEMMTLDALIHEIAKNIYDHAGGTGELTIEEIEPDVFSFSIRDCGTITYEFEKCIGRSTKAGNGVNCGVGLRIIRDHAAFLDIDLKIDTSKGFSYSGTYKKKFA